MPFHRRTVEITYDEASDEIEVETNGLPYHEVLGLLRFAYKEWDCGSFFDDDEELD